MGKDSFFKKIKMEFYRFLPKSQILGFIPRAIVTLATIGLNYADLHPSINAIATHMITAASVLHIANHEPHAAFLLYALSGEWYASSPLFYFFMYTVLTPGVRYAMDYNNTNTTD
jgi:hypothetical protein